MSLRLANDESEALIKEKGFTVTEKTIKHNGNVIVDMNQFDTEFSYLIDYFKDENGSYLIVSEVGTDYMKSSSDANILSRNKLFICDLSTGKKYTYIYTTDGLILSKENYEGLPVGITIKSIDNATKSISFEKKHNDYVIIKVPMVEVSSF
ncbi:hypothetical protein [Kordia antarctica]|nr:hypothetical protein [Kordia antarctica]